VASNLDGLQALATANKLASITLTDSGTPALSVTAGQTTSDASVFAAMTGTYKVAVTDSAAHVVANLNSLETEAVSGKLSSITLTDSGTPTLTLTSWQQANDTAALNTIAGHYTATTVTANQASIQTANINILGVADNASDAANQAATIDAGTTSLASYVNTLIGQAQTTMVPSLICYDFFYGKTPAAGGSDYLANFCTQLASAGFSTLNVWVNLGASFAANGSFGTTYASMTRDAFVDAAYQAVFGTAASASAHSTLVNSMNFYATFAGSELGARGAEVGIMLSLAGTTAGTNYNQAVTHFLQDAANETPTYQTPLIGTYLAGSAPHIG
jgi:hypothetical protein